MVKLLELVKSYNEFKAQPTEVEQDEPEGDPPLDDPVPSAPDSTQPPALEPPSHGGLAQSSDSLGIDPERGQVSAPSPAVSPPAPLQPPALHPAPGFAAATSTVGELGESSAPPSPMSSPAADLRAKAIRAQLQRDSAELYAKTLAVVSGLFEAAAMERLSPGRLITAAHEAEQVAAELAEGPVRGDELLALALGTYPEGEGFVLPHSVNVAILAAYVGHQLQLSPAGRTTAVLAGLAHDIGNISLPSGLLYKEEALTSQELTEVRKRPGFSHDLLLALGPAFQEIAEIAHQVYERMDGSGYPKGLEGNQILVEARILGAVDFFETTIHPRPYRVPPPVGGNFGIQTLMQMANQFGQDVLKALVRSVGLFPVGTYVRLSTGEIARVIMVSGDNPMRPVVEVLFDRKLRPLETTRRIDLIESPHLFVSKPCSNADLAELGIVDVSTLTNESVISAEPDEDLASGTALDRG